MQNLYPIKTGFEKLDEITGGFFPGEVTLIGSRPAIGKSYFLLALIRNITCGYGIPGLFFSVEMPKEYIYTRMASIHSHIPTSRIRNGRISCSEKELVEAVFKQIKDLPLIINDKPDLNINELCDEARRLYKEKDIKIIYIDYLGLLTTDHDDWDVWEQISYIIKKIRLLARELNIPIVLLCQVARDASGALPDLSHLRGSGDLEAVSDVVLLIHRDRPSSCEIQFQTTKLIIAKNHNGALGEIDFSFELGTGTYEEMPQTAAPNGTAKDGNEETES